jgi:hypothetical protein
MSVLPLTDIIPEQLPTYLIVDLQHRLKNMNNSVNYISSYSVDNYAYISNINGYAVSGYYNITGQYVIEYEDFKNYHSSQGKVLE